MPARIETRPWTAGMERAARRGLLPTSLDSGELRSRLSAEVRRAAVFAARLESARTLQRLSDLMARIIGGPTAADEAARAEGRAPLLLSIPEAKAQLREGLLAEGYAPDPDDEGTLKDLTSDRRLDLIVRTQEQLAAGYGRHLRDQDADILDLWPAQELVRVRPSEEERDWATRWITAGAATGRAVLDGWIDSPFVALKNHPIWDRLGDPALFDDALGNPYEPFAFNSGMGLRDVRRDHAERLGILPRNAPAPAPQPLGSLPAQAGVEDLDTLLQEVLAEDGGLTMEDGVLRLA